MMQRKVGWEESKSSFDSHISLLTSHVSVVEEHSVVGRSMIERTCGRGRRENAGISSESKVRILAVENLRFPGEGSSAQGKSGPKARPEGVVD